MIGQFYQLFYTSLRLTRAWIYILGIETAEKSISFSLLSFYNNSLVFDKPVRVFVGSTRALDVTPVQNDVLSKLSLFTFIQCDLVQKYVKSNFYAMAQHILYDTKYRNSERSQLSFVENKPIEKKEQFSGNKIFKTLEKLKFISN